MRLLWEESGFELVGAFCVAAFALGGVWVALESIFGLSSVPAGLLSAAAAGWMLEMVSRRHYADRLPQPSASAMKRPAPSRVGRAATASAPVVRQPTTAPASAPARGTRQRPAAPAADRRQGAPTVAGQRAGSTRRAA